MTPQKQKHLIISLALSAATLFFAYLYFAPSPKKNLAPTRQTEIKNMTNYDSILTNLLKDSSSHFRKTFDSIYKQPQMKIIKKQNTDKLNHNLKQNKNE